MPEARGDNKGFLTVTQALTRVKKVLESDEYSIVGEVSEVSDKPGYKAVYFTISDESSALSCMMWKNVYEAQGICIEAGLSVELIGTFSIYAAKGRMNFVAKKINIAGEGYLRMKVAKIAQKLQSEGLMETSRKRTLPALPERIAVVTSPRGKAIHDVLRTLKRRANYIEVLAFGVAVEGVSAPAMMAEALIQAAESGAELVLLVRGGGSYEDLMPFNDEGLARVVAGLNIPVVTGIGHEPDNSIVDMVADLRASTPTAAAEAASVSTLDIASKMTTLMSRMCLRLDVDLTAYETSLEAQSRRKVLLDPSSVLVPFEIRLDLGQDGLLSALPGLISRWSEGLSKLSLDFQKTGRSLFNKKENDLIRSASQLEALSPVAVLARGYSIGFDDKGHALRSVDAVEIGTPIKLRMNDGSIGCIVNQKEEKC